MLKKDNFMLKKDNFHFGMKKANNQKSEASFKNNFVNFPKLMSKVSLSHFVVEIIGLEVRPLKNVVKVKIHKTVSLSLKPMDHRWPYRAW